MGMAAQSSWDHVFWFCSSVFPGYAVHMSYICPLEVCCSVVISVFTDVCHLSPVSSMFIPKLFHCRSLITNDTLSCHQSTVSMDLPILDLPCK